MPSVLLKTNAQMDEQVKNKVMKELTGAVKEATGKPEAFILISIDECSMMFGGTTDLCAYIFLASLGSLGGSTNPELTKAFSAILEKNANIPASRLYVQFCDVDNRNDFGWNGSTFA